MWSQRREKAYIIGRVATTVTSKHSIVIDFGNGGHKRVERNVDTLRGKQALWCRETLQIAGLQKVAERYDSS